MPARTAHGTAIYVTADVRAIEAKVFDYIDTFATLHGRVTVSPFLSSVDATAPSPTKPIPPPTVVPPLSPGALGGILTSDLTLRAVDTPHTLSANLLVSTGVKLTLEPGVILKANTGKAIRIDGTLVADGATTNPIRFTSSATTPAPGDWNGIIFGGSAVDAVLDANLNYVSGSILRNVTFEFGGGIHVEDSFPLIESSTIRRNTLWSGTSSPGTSSLHGAGALTGLHEATDASKTFVVRNNRFEDNEDFAFTDQDGSIYSGGGRGTILFTGNVVTRNGGGVLLAASTSLFALRVLNNTFEANNFVPKPNLGAGVRVGPPLVVLVDEGAGTLIEGNTFRANQLDASITESSAGILVFPRRSYPAGCCTPVTIRQNRFIDNVSLNTTSASAILGYGQPVNDGNPPSGVPPLITQNTFEGNRSPHATIMLNSGVTPFKNNNLIGNVAPYDLYLVNPTRAPIDLDATNNFWNTVSESAVASRVFDFFDTLATPHGKVTFMPVLSAREPLAP